MEEEPFLYLLFEMVYTVTTNGIIVHQEIGVRFVLCHQMANPVRFVAGLCPNVGGRRKSEGVLLVRSRVKVIEAFETSQRRCRRTQIIPSSPIEE
jgi:hypothetical protein